MKQKKGASGIHGVYWQCPVKNTRWTLSFSQVLSVETDFFFTLRQPVDHAQSLAAVEMTICLELPLRQGLTFC
ncbi:MAG: hypothetical protein LBD10_06100 [Desulfobulbus sp.]|uniref:hypothetical protein n=1 Tax=Desulfobulbus sp. TaxID=895 RepID=UPI002846B15D|nr:hypothetical protein [Desulfobulbus sp.]MDR2549750.1 hypothetical protein [Desulfobulbus sp.]